MAGDIVTTGPTAGPPGEPTPVAAHRWRSAVSLHVTRLTSAARSVPVPPWVRGHPVATGVGAAVLATGVVLLCLLLGLPPALPFALALLVVLALRPLAGMAYATVVLTVPLGLWAVGGQALVGWAFGGRDYALSMSAVAVVFAHAATTLARRRPNRRVLALALPTAAVLLAACAIGVAHHGLPQTVIGARYILFPLAVLVVVRALPAGDVSRLGTVLAWVLVANGVAAVVEFAIGPQRLAALGFDHGPALRYIDGTFRAPGLTEFNAALGMLAGAYLLGYVGLWLTRTARPRRRSWHAGALAAVVCLALSTSRSGAVLLVGGVVAAVALNRSGGPAARRRARLFGLGLLGLVAAAFVALGATGASSLFQRFDVWRDLLSHNLPLYGLGVGAVGAASNSRVAGGQRVFTDNYFISLALQFGPIVLALLVIALVAAVVLLYRRSATRPISVLYLAALAGLAAASLLIEAWEYDGAMLCLAVLVGYGLRRDNPED